ncbi:hypothetical protein AX774_g3110 [Zancudomyces culisetae]|uniref:ELYS-like domain-containing protein n=1 Tax=Zancudomyces culisetae TaxID=1213189 RepID=A0A1R1PQX0_ZANCU|nr:hypothetical protein AX774_g3110 [Zancudomyces culisetae]|eukprot:OMH83385.1 hypothetical protein AX774_g3110 [Zancudomyces culisetae]
MQYGNGMGLVGPIQGKKDEWVMFITTRNGKVGIVKFGIDKKGGQIKVYEEEAQVQDIELFNSPYRKVNATIIDEKEGKVLVFIEKGYGRMSIYMYQDKSRKAKQQQEYLQQRQKLKRRQGWGQEHEQKQKQKQEQEHEQERERERERERGQEPEKKVMEKIIGAGISIGKKREMEIQSIWVEKENGGHLCVGYKGLEEGELYAVIYKLSSNVQNEDRATENGVVRRLSRKIEQKTVKDEVWDIKKILELEIRKETKQEISLFKMFNSTGILLGLNVGDTGKNSRLNYWEIREGKLIKVQETHFSDSIVDVVVNENLDMTVIGDRSNHVISSFEQKTLVQETFDMAKDISKYYSFASGESGHENNENEILKRLFALGGISSDAQSFRFNEKQALDVTNRIIINGELDMQDRLGLLYYMILDTSNGDQEKAAKMAENYCLPNEFIELYRGYYLLDTGSVRDGLNSVIQSSIANTEDAQLNELIIDLAPSCEIFDAADRSQADHYSSIENKPEIGLFVLQSTQTALDSNPDF